MTNRLKKIFLDDSCWVFWLFMFISASIFTFWLLGQLPGAVSPDSFYQLSQTKTLVFNDAHPYVSSLYLLVLMQFHDSFLPVAIFQILATSFLVSYIFYFAVKNGVKFYLVLPFFLALFLSIPVGLFNIIIWKDVPFSLLVLFFGFLLFYLGFKKKKGEPVNWSFLKIILLSFLFIIMVMLRHNGLLFLVVLPLCIFLAKLMSKPVFLKFILCSAVFLVIFKVVIPMLITVQKNPAAFSSLVWKVTPLVSMVYSPQYISDNSLRDREIVSKVVEPEVIQKYLNSPSPWDIAAYTSFTNLSDEDVKAFNHLYYRAIIINLPLYLGERTQKLFILLSPRVNVWANDYLTPEYLKSYVYQWPGLGDYLSFYPVKGILNQELKLINFAQNFRPIIFDLLYPTLILLIILLLYRFLPISALVSFFFLSQLPFWLIMTISPEFRYLYSIFLAYFIIFPLILLELQLSRKKLSKILIAVILTIFLLPYLIGGMVIYKYRSEITSYKVVVSQTKK